MAQINVRIDEDVKSSAELLFSRLGMNMSTAITIFLHQALDCNGLPFHVYVRDPFYSEANQARLNRIKADFDDGMRNYHAHELIDANADSVPVKRNRRCHAKAMA